MGGFDRERALANAEAKKRKEDALARRRRTALRILDGGGTILAAMQASSSARETVKAWDAERTARQTASDNGSGRSE